MIDSVEKKTVEITVHENLCCNCGTCISACPHDAITMHYDKQRCILVPRIDHIRCTVCGFCFAACPGLGIDFQGIIKANFSSESEIDPLLGCVQECFLGYAEPAIRYHASSGGIVTGILIHALKSGLIDGAIVTRMKTGRPWEPESFIATTCEDILQAARSKYCPVPVNAVVRDVLNSPEGSRFAIVGLPCHIHGVRKLETRNAALKKKIVLHIGLFCSHNDTFCQMERLLKRLRILKEDIQQLQYRGDGWPGNFSVLKKDGIKISIPFKEAIFPHLFWFYALNRCLYCCDVTAELSDISAGDPWISEMKDEKIGQSLVILRSEAGRQFFSHAVQQGALIARPVSPERVKRSISMGTTKKKDVQTRLRIRQIQGKRIPMYNTDLMEPGFLNSIRSVIPILSVFASSRKNFRKGVDIFIAIGLFVYKIQNRGK